MPVLECATCHEVLARESFSKNQLKKQGLRRCYACVDARRCPGDVVLATTARRARTAKWTCTHCKAKIPKAVCSVCGAPYCDMECYVDGFRAHERVCSGGPLQHATGKHIECAERRRQEQSGVSPHLRFNPALYAAAENGDPHTIARILKGAKTPGLDGPHPEGLGRTPLHICAVNDRTAAARILLEHGADVHARNVGGYQPIHNAMFHGNAETAFVLLEYGASLVDDNNPEKCTPLCVTDRHYKNKGTTELVLDYAAKLAAKDDGKGGETGGRGGGKGGETASGGGGGGGGWGILGSLVSGIGGILGVGGETRKETRTGGAGADKEVSAEGEGHAALGMSESDFELDVSDAVDDNDDADEDWQVVSTSLRPFPTNPEPSRYPLGAASPSQCVARR